MPYRLEIALKPEMVDAEGEGIRRKASDYFGIAIAQVRTVQILTIDAALSADQLGAVQTEIFTNPVTQTSAYDPLPIPFDWCIWVGYRPGVRDNPGSTAVEAIEDLLKIRFARNEAVFTSKRYCLEAAGLQSSHRGMPGQRLDGLCFRDRPGRVPLYWTRTKRILHKCGR
ncbi:MAG: hypothetical protein R6X05_11840 [Desulfobacterales bacterium]